jgi:hypothetical protein
MSTSGPEYIIEDTLDLTKCLMVPYLGKEVLLLQQSLKLANLKQLPHLTYIWLYTVKIQATF